MDLALDSLRWLRKSNDLGDEIQRLVSEDKGESKTIWNLMSDSGQRLALLICICLHLARQCTGTIALMFYSSQIFDEAGLGNLSEYGTLLIGVVTLIMIICTIPCMYKIGRRKLELFGLTGLMICLTMITIALHLLKLEESKTKNGINPQVNGAGIFLIISSLAFVSFNCIGVSTVPWTVTSELFCQEYKSPAASICVFINRLSNLIQALLFPTIQSLLQEYCFLPYLVIALVLFIVLFIYFIEPKGRTPIEVTRFLNDSKAWSWKDPVGFKFAD